MVLLEEATIAQLQKSLSDQTITTRALVLQYIERIAQIDSCVGGLNSVLELNPDMLAIADQLDQMRSEGKVLSKLHGIPILLKDNINTADRMHTSASALALGDHYARQDAFVVERLRKAGALILGKANMTEYANYMSYHMPGGYSSRGGQVLCPYDASVNPMGSSSGSAVSVSANLCTVAVGTETSGSILYPAAVNGVVGLKPTAGLISRSGIIPISCTLDTAGPIARTVEDAAALLEALVGEDPKDPSTFAAKTQDYCAALGSKSLGGLRIGLSHISTEPVESKQQLQSVIDLLRGQGSVLVEILPLETVTETTPIMNHEFRSAIDYYLSQEDATVKTLSDIVRFNQDHAACALRYGQQRMLDGHNNSTCRHIDPPYLAALKKREQDIARLDQIFDEHQLDVILMTDKSNFPAFTGFPALTLPIGCNEKNLPAAVCWVGRRFDEAQLLAVAYAVEQCLGKRFAPQ